VAVEPLAAALKRILMRSSRSLHYGPASRSTPTRRFAPTSPFQGEVEQRNVSYQEVETPHRRLALSLPLKGGGIGWGSHAQNRRRRRSIRSERKSLRNSSLCSIRGKSGAFSSAPIPKFATPCGTLSRELRNRKGTTNPTILVWL
jgi:hypothetical protein